MKEKESDIQKAILEYLKLKSHFCWRNNSGAFKTERGGFYRMGTPGAPDIFLVKRPVGTFVGIEVKTLKGVLSEPQRAFSRELEAHGGIYLVARSVDDVIAAGL